MTERHARAPRARRRRHVARSSRVATAGLAFGLTGFLVAGMALDNPSLQRVPATSAPAADDAGASATVAPAVPAARTPTAERTPTTARRPVTKSRAS